jgi:iron complex outermembrane receptor protein
VDGRSIYNPVIGGVAWSDLPLAMEDIERIEVIRGSNAAAFGSNSFSGVINIITKDPSEQQGTLVKTTLGDKNTRQILARNAGTLGDLNYRLTINYDEKDGLKTRYDDATNKWLSFRGDYQYDSNDKLTFQTGYSKGTQQTDWLLERDTGSTSSYQQIKWTHTKDQDTEYSLHFFHNHKELDDTFIFQHPSTGPINLLTGFSYESDRYELEFQHKLKPASDLRLVWGAGLRHDNTISPDTLNQDSAAIRNQVHAFVNAEWKPKDDLTVNLGAMLEKYEGFSGLFSPRVALNYSLKKNHIFRISHSRAYRMPNVWEEQIDLKIFRAADSLLIDQLHQTVGLPDPEEINSIELGYMAAFEDIPLTMDVKLFKEKISPVINYAWDNSTSCGCPLDNGAGNFNNDGEVDIDGLEIQLDFQPTTNTNIHAVYSYLNASGWQVSGYDNNGLSDEYIDISEIVPTETFGILASHRFDNGIQVSSGFYHTDRVLWLSPGNETDSYNKWDFRIGKTFTLPDATIDVSAIVHNVSKEKYQEYYEENEARREIYLQVGVSF